MPRPASIVLLAILVAGLGLGVPAFVSEPAPEGSALPPASIDTPPELDALFGELERAWNPRVHERILQRAGVDAPRLAPLLSRVLDQAAHPRLGSAILVAGALRIEAAHPTLVELVGTAPEHLQGAALTAAARIVPWPPESLRVAFASPNADLRAAAATLAAARPDEWPESLVQLLADPDGRVRDTVVNSMPRVLSAPAHAALLALARESTAHGRAAAARALGRGMCDPASEAMLTTLLADDNPSVRIAALESLSHKRSRLSEPDAVWAIAQAPGSSPTERAWALRCVEQTGSYSAPAIEHSLAVIDSPLPRLLVARCLIAAGDARGAMMLIDLLSADDDPDPDDESGIPADDLRFAARQVLAEITGTGTDAGTAVWHDRLHATSQLRARTLRTPPPDF